MRPECLNWLGLAGQGKASTFRTQLAGVIASSATGNRPGAVARGTSVRPSACRPICRLTRVAGHSASWGALACTVELPRVPGALSAAAVA
jgi:hypothetical protein